MGSIETTACREGVLRRRSTATQIQLAQATRALRLKQGLDEACGSSILPLLSDHAAGAHKAEAHAMRLADGIAGIRYEEAKLRAPDHLKRSAGWPYWEVRLALERDPQAVLNGLPLLL
eukprot:6178594-Pleurochrysis_carterae.AAC.3